MRRTNLVLLACLQLCRAKQPGFSIHEDILAHPQFEVVFSESFILEKDAQLLLDGANRREPSAYNADSATTQTGVASPAHESAAVDGIKQQPPQGGAGGGGGAGSPPASNGGPYGDPEDAADGSAQVSETFEIMNVPPVRYLCSVPVLAPPAPPNQTATDIARAEEARELDRMSGRGVEIISTLEGECMYYVSGWWSYSFCYGKEIVQFHALTTKTGKPVKDPHSQEYILGRMQGKHETDAAAVAADKASGKHTAQKIKGDVDVQKPLGGGGGSGSGSNAKTGGGGSGDGAKDYDPHNTELQVKGDQKYMVQRLGAGTVCDLTGRERTVEVQYHCNPGGSNDRISWIKEVTTCTYLMEVRTPRLCEESAFMPPKPTRAHPISCRLIVGSEEEAAQWHQQKTIEAYASMRGKKAQQVQQKQQQQKEPEQGQEQAQEQQPGQDGIVVGGVVIGARKALGRGEDGQPPLKLEPPKNFATDGPQAPKGDARVVQVLARAASHNDGGAVEILPEAELAKLDITYSVIHELAGKLNKIAGGKAWRLEAVENPGDPNLEIRAVLEPEDDDDDDDGGKAKWASGVAEEKQEVGTGGQPVPDAPAADNNARQNDNLPDEVPDVVPDEVTVTVKKVDAATDAPEAPGEKGNRNEGSEETFKKDEL